MPLLLKRIMTVIDEYESDVSNVSVLGILELVKNSY